MEKKRIPIGISDFKTLIENSYYFVDKSMLIDEILINKPQVLLLPRPRRFGKTLNMSMIKYFFDIENGKENRKLFNGLAIEKTRWINEQGKYPVIHISMKELKKDSYEECIAGVKSLLSSLFNQFLYVKEKLNSEEIKKFDDIWKMGNEGEYSVGVKILSEALYKYHKTKPIILIDEYDAPMTYAFDKGYYDKINSLFSEFYSSILKDSNIEFAVVTGILRIVKENIFSDLNNLFVSGITDERYMHFGIKEEEVVEILNYYGLNYEINEVKDWYNGYLFGNEKVYNPWSILNFTMCKELRAYWVNTSGNLLIRQVLESADEITYNDLVKLAKGEILEKTVQEATLFRNLTNKNSLWFLLLNSGYLTTDGKGQELREFKIKIPNKEVRSFFEESFINILTNDDEDSFSCMRKALITGNITGIDSFEFYLREIFKKSLSYYDTDKKEEKFYHNLILGMLLGMERNFFVRSNREDAYGRYDLTLEPKDKNKIGYIFEFKIASSKEEMSGMLIKGMKQIKEKKYGTEMSERGIKNILGISLVFYQKELLVLEERIEEKNN